MRIQWLVIALALICCPTVLAQKNPVLPRQAVSSTLSKSTSVDPTRSSRLASPTLESLEVARSTVSDTTPSIAQTDFSPSELSRVTGGTHSASSTVGAFTVTSSTASSSPAASGNSMIILSICK